MSSRIFLYITLIARLATALPQSGIVTDLKPPRISFTNLQCNPWTENGAHWFPQNGDPSTKRIGFSDGSTTLCDSPPGEQRQTYARMVGQKKVIKNSPIMGTAIGTYGEELSLELMIYSEQDWQWPDFATCKAAMNVFLNDGGDRNKIPCYGEDKDDSMLGSFKDTESGLIYSVVAKVIQ